MRHYSEPGFIFGIPIIAFVTLVVLAEIMLSMHQHSLAKSDRIDALAFATDLRTRSEQQLNRVLHLTSGLSSYFAVRRNDLKQQEVEDILRIAHQTTLHVRNFGVAVGYRITYLYPLEGNEQVLGMDYRSQPEQWPAVEATIVGRKAVMDEQVKLLQGGTAMIYREPIFVDDTYWGLLSTVIDSDSFLADTFGKINQTHYQFAVSSSRGHNLWGEAALFKDPQAVVITSERGWRFAVKLLDAGGRVPFGLLRLVGWVFALMMAMGLYSILAHRRTLAHLALHDPVTGLPNRTLLNDRIEHAMLLARRKPEEGLVVVFIDLDDFKIINDTYGHRTGDFVLKTVAQRLESCARIGDTTARWAGDEFVVLVENLDSSEIDPLLERLAKAIAEPIYHDGHRLQISASFGYAVAFKDADTAADLVWAADRRMYAHKTRRKQRI
ncbi:MAG TPA: diguanylate cyclase [Cellvibrio sp.]|nr:diguanylate cyclase [Cellvibrio sp.]